MKIFLIVLPLFALTPLWGQKEVISQKQIWYKYNLRVPLSEKWIIRQEFDDRNFIDPGRQSQFLSRTHLQRNIGKKGWNVALGFAYFLHSLPQDPEVQDYYNQNELRPSFEISNLNQINSRLHLHHRYWTELRFFQQPDDAYTLGTVRIRYKLELEYELSEKFILRVFDELHINLSSNITYNVFDQNRLGAAVMYSPVKNVGFELMYINWFQQTPKGDLYYNRDILRVALHHTLQLRKHSKE